MRDLSTFGSMIPESMRIISGVHGLRMRGLSLWGTAGGAPGALPMSTAATALGGGPTALATSGLGLAMTTGGGAACLGGHFGTAGAAPATGNDEDDATPPDFSKGLFALIGLSGTDDADAPPEDAAALAAAAGAELLEAPEPEDPRCKMLINAKRRRRMAMLLVTKTACLFALFTCILRTQRTMRTNLRDAGTGGACLRGGSSL